MKNKPVILVMYGVALYFILRKYYTNGNTGLPVPTVLSAPTYLYGVGLLASDFLGGVPTVIMAGLTLGLIYQTQNGSSTGWVAKATAGPPGTQGPVGKPSTPAGAATPPSTQGPVGPKGPQGPSTGPVGPGGPVGP